MKTYWFAFRLNHDIDYNDRYDRVMNTLKGLSDGKWWVEPSAFVVFRSDLNIDAVASEISAAMDTRVDVGLLGMSEIKAARVLGASNDDDIFEFMPFAKWA